MGEIPYDLAEMSFGVIGEMLYEQCIASSIFQFHRDMTELASAMVTNLFNTYMQRYN